MQQNDNQNQPRPRKKIDWLLIVFIAIIIISLITLFTQLSSSQVKTLTYADYYTLVENSKVSTAEVSPAGGENYGLFEISGVYNAGDGDARYYVVVTEEQLNKLMTTDNANKFVITPISENFFLSFILSLLPYIIVVVLFLFLFRGQGNSKAFDFAKSTARLTREKTVTFKDVAGCDEEKEELVEIIDFLRNPRKYVEVGARIPRVFYLLALQELVKLY